jgi:predicted AlkP superfamily pyrophosphatase or phosphodiesterase
MKHFFILLLSCFLTAVYGQSKKLLIIGIDGCRADVLTKQFAPAMDSMVHLPNTAYTYSMKTERRTMSAPNWASMLTGVHCNRHDAKMNNFRFNKIDKYPHFYKYLEAHDSSIQTLSFPHWMPINKYIVRNNADVAPYLEKEPSDADVKKEAVLELAASSVPDAMFIHFDDVDHNGHAFGFDPGNKKYTDAVSAVDGYIKEILSHVRDREKQFHEDWLVIISTDHGGRKNGRGGHAMGTFNKHIRYVFLIMNGSDVQPGKIPNANTVDIAYTALKFFNIDIKKEWQLQGKSVGLKEEQPITQSAQ